jgi:CheY-like chemotaxis protein
MESLQGKRVLVVDDEPDVCEVLRDLLLDLGLGVDIAHSAAEAFHLYAENEYDLVTLDVCMPGTDGVALHQTLSCSFGHGKRVSPTLPQRMPPILVVTGYSQDEVLRQLVFGERVVGVLQKPISAEQFQRVVRDLLEWESLRVTRRQAAVRRLSSRMVRTG